MTTNAVADRPLLSASELRSHAAFVVAALACVAAFAWMLTYGTGSLAVEDSFGNFYDYQAQAWLHGRWDVPEPALGGEAFLVDGKVYGYFGPTPALLRLPFVALGVGFGRLTRIFMLLDYTAALIAAYGILRLAVRRTGGTAPTTWLTVTFTAAVGLGSTLFFLGSRAYVYHEAILCGAAFTLWSVWCSLRYWGEENTRWWIGAVVCATLAVQARPPIGLFGLTLLGCVALYHAIDRRRLAALGIAGAAAAGVLSYSAISYLKFRTFEGCPLRLNVQYTPERLAPLEGRNFHLSNLRFNADSYLFRRSVTLHRSFPYVQVEYLDRLKNYPESKIAYRDPTLALPYAMPALVFLALTGGALAIFVRPAPHWPIALLWIAAVPMGVAMLTAVAVTQRYTADFCGWLIPAAAFGGALLDRLATPWRRAGAALVIVATLASIAIEAAVTLRHQRAIVWGVPEAAHREYLDWQRRIDAFFAKPTPP